MSKNTKFLCCLTTFQTVVCLGAAGLADEAQVEYDEHLFIAGNDSTGTASITYASRVNPHPITIRFENFSYPDSCAFHPSRCRNLTYLSSTTDVNHTQLIFYVPLTKSALGVMEFFYNGTTLSHVQIRTVNVPRPCNPISVINVFGTLQLLCLLHNGQQDLIMLCKVRNSMSVRDITLSCSSPKYIPFNLSRLSNFVVYGNRWIDAYIYFTYENAMYAKIPSQAGHVNILATLPPGYTYCRHLDFVNSSIPLIASYCYTNENRIQVVYFDLNGDTFSEQRNASHVVRYHCPSPQTFVGVATVGAFASFWQGERYRGSFSIIGNSVSFARCFEFGGSLYFLYHDKQYGTFIKPHISKNLRATVEQLSLQSCVNSACEQPLIFDNRYILVQVENSNLHNWTLQLVDMARGWNNSLLTFNSSSTSQLALISDFIHVPMDPSPATTAKPGVDKPKSSSAAVIGTSATFPTVFVLLIVITVATPLLVNHFKQSHRRQRKRGSYSVVQQRNESNSRQQSPTEGEMEMEDLSHEQNHEQQCISSASSIIELAANHQEDTVCINPATHSSTNSNDHSENPEPATCLDRERYRVVGSNRSMEDMQRSLVTTRQQPPPPPQGQTSTATQGQGNATIPPQPDDSAQVLPHGGVSSSSAANASTIPVPLHSQHSNDRTANFTDSGSVSVPAHSQATRPQSLVNFTPNQHSQASPSSAPPPPTNYSTVQCPSWMNSTESNASHTSCNSDGCISSATTPAGPPFNAQNGTPSSLMDFSVAASYTASQNSLHHDGSGHGFLPMDRSAYRAVGCSHEDVQRPHQCTQQPAVGQSGNTNTSSVGYTGTSSTASTPHQQYGGAMGYTGTDSASSTPQQQYPCNSPSLGASPSMASHSGVICHYNSQCSNDSTGSGSSSIPDNSISAHSFHSQPTRRQSLTYTSSPFVHNQTTGPNYYTAASQPPVLNRMDSNTSQNSGAGVRTPTDSSTPIFFPSPNQGSICPPSHVPLSAAQHATNT